MKNKEQNLLDSLSYRDKDMHKYQPNLRFGVMICTKCKNTYDVAELICPNNSCGEVNPINEEVNRRLTITRNHIIAQIIEEHNAEIPKKSSPIERQYKSAREFKVD